MVMIDKDIEARVRDWTGETDEAAGSLTRGFCASSQGIFAGLARCLMGNLDVEKYFGNVEKYKMGEPADRGESKKTAKNGSSDSSSAEIVDKKEALAKLKEEMGDDFPEGFSADDIPEDIAKGLLTDGQLSKKVQKFMERLAKRNEDSEDKKEAKQEDKDDKKIAGEVDADKLAVSSTPVDTSVSSSEAASAKN